MEIKQESFVRQRVCILREDETDYSALFGRRPHMSVKYFVKEMFEMQRELMYAYWIPTPVKNKAGRDVFDIEILYFMDKDQVREFLSEENPQIIPQVEDMFNSRVKWDEDLLMINYEG